MLDLKQLERSLGHDPKFSSHFFEVIPDALVDVNMVYASKDNFMHENMYQSFQKAWLHRQAYEKFSEAKSLLKSKNRGLKFMVYDALRPWRFQVTMFAKVKGTAQETYVADPDKGSLHNYGMAMDLTLATLDGNALDMGSAFDEFAEVSQPQLEEKLLQAGKLSHAQLENRLFLRELMAASGFISIPNEWWHFNSCSLEEAKKIAPRID